MSEWTEEDFESDLDKISHKDFSNLSFTKPGKEPPDAFLRYRYDFIRLLDVFERNDFAHALHQANANLQPMLEYLASFNETHLASYQPAPPFDFLLLTFVVTKGSQPSHSLLIKLFQHYKGIRDLLDGQLPRIFLNDRTRLREVEVDLSEAKRIVQSRVDYLAELATSLLYEKNQWQMLAAFLKDLAPPSITDNEETLSHLGRLCVAFGDGDRAVGYFSKVNAADFRAANQGYINYFTGKFRDALEKFQEAGKKAPSNYQLCAKHAGDLKTDTTETGSGTKKLSPEERSQWPIDPRPA
jgi:tetratricopeptide (TPR) repeat protein